MKYLVLKMKFNDNIFFIDFLRKWKASLFCWFSIFVFKALFLVSCNLDSPAAGKQVFVSEGFENKIVDGYWLYLPNNFSKKRDWPIILFLQGGYGTSPNPKTAKNDGPAKYVFEEKVNEELYHYVADSFIIINPHMRTGPKEKRQWHQYGETLIQVVDEVLAKYNGNSEKLYLTGLSRGGVGSWELAKQYPEKFAAIMPIAGVVTCRNNCEVLQQIPTWIIHNKGDDAISIDYPRSTVSYYDKKFGIEFYNISHTHPTKTELVKNYIFSELDKQGHDAWNVTYASTEIYQWFLRHKKK